MVVLGQDPDVVDKGWGDEDDPAPHFYNGNIRTLLHYFFYHPRIKFGRPTPGRRDVGALSASISRLLDVYPPEAVKRAMDRFYLTRTAQRHPNPALAFCNKNFQDKLFAGQEVEPQDAVLRFIYEGFDRPAGLDLPWDESHDADIMHDFASHYSYVQLTLTYPDVVAEILAEWGPSYERAMDVAMSQYFWLRGIVTEPVDVSILTSKFPLPKDFLDLSKVRDVQATIRDAVRIAQTRGR